MDEGRIHEEHKQKKKKKKQVIFKICQGANNHYTGARFWRHRELGQKLDLVER